MRKMPLWFLLACALLLGGCAPERPREAADGRIVIDGDIYFKVTFFIIFTSICISISNYIITTFWTFTYYISIKPKISIFFYTYFFFIKHFSYFITS